MVQLPTVGGTPLLPLHQDILKEFNKFKQKNGQSLPKYKNWDWDDFILALFETKVINQGLEPVYFPSNIEERVLQRPNYVSDADYKKYWPEGIEKNQDPGQGGWRYAWYIPEWSHPNHDPNLLVEYPPEFRHRPSKEPLHRLRPALRTVDKYRNPSEWAKRFGIHPDERGGRSRLSPTLAPSRNPLEDVATQFKLVDDATQAEVIRESRERAKKDGKKVGADYIDPDVMDRILEEVGVSRKMLRENLEKGLSHGENVEQLLSEASKKNPLFARMHANFIRNVLEDQDYQRVLFHDMTSDELIRHEIFTMKDGPKSDLDNDLEPLFRRERWLPTSRRGHEKFAPRLLYNLDGVRGEYDVHNNDVLWEALQPALRLVSKVIESRPPLLEALFEMKTRRHIPRKQDLRRKPLQPGFPNRLYMYDWVENIDLAHTLPELKALQDLGFDWRAATWQRLQKQFSVDIGCAFWAPGRGLTDAPDVVDGVRKLDVMTYGITCYLPKDNPDEPLWINITVAAEMIWPLLTNQYSESEKMVCSFTIATILLHEFAHAICFAQMEICAWAPRNNHPPGRLHDIDRLLDAVGAKMFGTDIHNHEPFWRSSHVSELGFDFENSLWGRVPHNTLGNHLMNKTRYITTLPFMLTGFDILRAKPVPSMGFGTKDNSRRTGSFPVDSFGIHLPIPYMAKFFTNEFWDNEYLRFGHESFKIYTPDYQLKACHEQFSYIGEDFMRAFGREEFFFVIFTIFSLELNYHGILSEWLTNTMHCVTGPWLFEHSYNHATKDIRDSSREIVQRVTALSKAWDEAVPIHNRRTQNQVTRIQAYLKYDRDWNPRDPHVRKLTFEQWNAELDGEWARFYGDGGTLLTHLGRVAELLQSDLLRFEFLVFQYFSLNIGGLMDARSIVLLGLHSTPVRLSQVFLYLDGRRQWVHRTCESLQQVCQIAELAPVQHVWGKWLARYKEYERGYGQLCDMLLEVSKPNPEDPKWKKSLKHVPSSYYKNRMDRMTVLGQREYVKADPRIREVIDECYRIIYRYKFKNVPIPALTDIPREEEMWASITADLEKLELGDLRPPPENPEANRFLTAQPLVYDNIFQSASPAFQDTAPDALGNTRAHVPGQTEWSQLKEAPLNPAAVLNATPPRRFPGLTGTPPNGKGSHSSGALGAGLENLASPSSSSSSSSSPPQSSSDSDDALGASLHEDDGGSPSVPKPLRHVGGKGASSGKKAKGLKRLGQEHADRWRGYARMRRWYASTTAAGDAATQATTFGAGAPFEGRSRLFDVQRAGQVVRPSRPPIFHHPYARLETVTQDVHDDWQQMIREAAFGPKDEMDVDSADEDSAA
ncbi:hypothetical protein GGS26DRAFT_590356 [Hypomontagnella submonticulosa]|nr:hypothetical protein GGS26DRAFT_590356 [Hypomontagnella submonticulosa]